MSWLCVRSPLAWCPVLDEVVEDAGEMGLLSVLPTPDSTDAFPFLVAFFLLRTEAVSVILPDDAVDGGDEILADVAEFGLEEERMDIAVPRGEVGDR
jgi:hypothetical protein